LAQYIDGRLFIVASGDDDTILDNIAFLKKCLHMSTVDFGGVMVNKVRDVQDFKEVYLPKITDMGMKVVGIIPYREELTHCSVKYLPDRLFAKLISGEGGLNNTVGNIVVGALGRVGDRTCFSRRISQGGRSWAAAQFPFLPSPARKALNTL
jgi:hypothetical protein